MMVNVILGALNKIMKIIAVTNSKDNNGHYHVIKEKHSPKII